MSSENDVLPPQGGHEVLGDEKDVYVRGSDPTPTYHTVGAR